VVVRSRADRRAALPGWRSLVVRASAAPVDVVDPPARTTAPPDRTALTTDPAPRGADTVDLTLRAEDTAAPNTCTATAHTAADRDPATPTRDAGA
jgi:hypothetical protein